MKTMKKTAFATALVCLLAAMAGCTSTSTGSTEGSADTAPSGETTELIWFTEALDETQLARYNKYIVDPFNEANPEYKVVINANADYEQVLKVQMASNDGPDIMNMGGPTMVSEYVDGGKVYDMTAKVDESGLRDVIFDWALNSCTLEGSVYSLPNSYEALMLWYNQDMFTEKGWEAPTTYAELETLAGEMQAESLIPIAFGTSDFKAINEQFLSVAFSNYAGRDNVVKALNGEMKWTDQVFVDAINTLNDMWQKGWINDKKSHAISDEDSNALFYSGQAPMRMTGSWALGIFAGKTDFTYSAVPFPSLNDGVPASLPLGIGGVTAINANTEHADICFEFIASQYENPELHAQAVAEGHQPLPMELSIEDYPDSMSDIDKEVLTMLAAVQTDLSASGHVMWTYWPAQTRQYMMDNIENIYLGNLTAEEYLAEAQELFDAELADGKVPVVS